MINLRHIEHQQRWRVFVVAMVAKLMGVLVHVEGIPYGSVRKLPPAQIKTAEGKIGTATAIRL